MCFDFAKIVWRSVIDRKFHHASYGVRHHTVYVTEDWRAVHVYLKKQHEFAIT